MKLHYLAYGSNLHPLRLQKRVPSARLIGVVEMPGWVLSFNKRSRDGSGKCTIAAAGAAQRAFGAVFTMDARDRESLDRIEGLGAGYAAHWLNLQVGGRTLRAFTYVASADYLDSSLRPYAWYKDLVLAGARHHGFHPQYVRSLEEVASIPDPDRARRRKNEAILARISAVGEID